jgi:hypothetical protein
MFIGEGNRGFADGVLSNNSQSVEKAWVKASIWTIVVQISQAEK